ncbi:MAG TPA: MoxR family ATPase [Fredinandcohnia sp.]|nr:MoxR family ATPase [Fredinandcohnia sp.]
MPFESIDDAQHRLAEAGYLANRSISTTVFLAERLGKPVLVEGPAGVGKTELAVALSKATGRPLVRLQCYEGLDESKALYEWEYSKQLLYTQMLRERIGEAVAGAKTLAEAVERLGESESVFFSERFLLPRPILRVLLADEPMLLLVDEIDKADPEFEAFLLEVLADYAVSIPEIGTFRARHEPMVVLTSNAVRELSDALKRRCLHLHIDFPEREQELAIVRAKVPGIAEALAARVVEAVQKLRAIDLKKAPSIAETLDWARALVLLGAEDLDPGVVSETLNLLLKYEVDVKRARERLADWAVR